MVTLNLGIEQTAISGINRLRFNRLFRRGDHFKVGREAIAANGHIQRGAEHIARDHAHHGEIIGFCMLIELAYQGRGDASDQ